MRLPCSEFHTAFLLILCVRHAGSGSIPTAGLIGTQLRISPSASSERDLPQHHGFRTFFVRLSSSLTVPPPARTYIIQQAQDAHVGFYVRAASSVTCQTPWRSEKRMKIQWSASAGDGPLYRAALMGSLNCEASVCCSSLALAVMIHLKSGAQLEHSRLSNQLK